jgi:hypothetical protein
MIVLLRRLIKKVSQKAESILEKKNFNMKLLIKSETKPKPNRLGHFLTQQKDVLALNHYMSK